MTATRDRRSDPADDAVETAWDDRPIHGSFPGLPWWGGVLLGFGLATVAAVIDMVRQDSLGVIYQGAYLLGCVGAVCLVRRRSLFGPMVQPPLVFAVTAIGAVLLLAPDAGGGGGLRALVFSVALPLTSNFPTMGITTAVTLAIGFYRLWKERDPNPPVRMTPRDRPPRAPDSPRQERPSKDRPAKERPTKDRPSKDRTKDRATKNRPAAPDPSPRSRQKERPAEDEEPRRGLRGRPSRDRDPGAERRTPSPRDRSTNRRDRDQSPADRDRRRPREDPPPRRRDPDSRPRRDDRPSSASRDQAERPRQPRRPPDQYR